MRTMLILIVLVISNLSSNQALAESLAGDISISLTIVPVCKVNVTNNEPAVNCGGGGKTQEPKISKKNIPGEAGITVDTTLVTLEW